ncbi:MAG: hypothetical protein A2047_00965 [Omnitrophica bacterium GWA2_41_15]|nr:MAG: hypothetical protein A2047_00965 [Omnitrophica bacterium GWA2_41_15]
MTNMCRFCGSKDFVRCGKRYNELRMRQVYKCKNCNRRFTHNDGFLNMKYDPELITLAIDLWVKGLSYRQIRDHIFNFHGIKVGHVTVLGWVRKYGEVIDDFTETLRPDLEGDWTADEMVQYFAKNHNWIWNLMHKDKKFLIASLMTAFREQKHANMLFEKGAARTTVPPRVVQTDGLPHYPQAIKQAFGNYGTKHIRHSMKSKVCMNPMERLQGTCRDRIKTTRGFHTVSSGRKAWKTWVNYYNFIREHSTIEKTPAEACGIDLGLKGNKWRCLIEKSVNGGV